MDERPDQCAYSTMSQIDQFKKMLDCKISEMRGILLGAWTQEGVLDERYQFLHNELVLMRQKLEDWPEEYLRGFDASACPPGLKRIAVENNQIIEFP